MKSNFARWQANFYTGLAIALPAIISVAIVKWLFGSISVLTDTLLIFLPQTLTHTEGGAGPMHWYWSLVALLVGVFLVGLLGGMARYYIGKKMIQLVDHLLLQVPVLNRIYGTVKQVKEAFASSGKSSFKQVVLVEFPRPGMQSLGFVTGEGFPEVQAKTSIAMLSVFVPTTPNPTSGFLVLVPEDQVIKLEMSVADAIKVIISLGSVTPEYPVPRRSGAEAIPANLAETVANPFEARAKDGV